MRSTALVTGSSGWTPITGVCITWAAVITERSAMFRTATILWRVETRGSTEPASILATMD
jgi:hypothetical protein